MKFYVEICAKMAEVFSRTLNSFGCVDQNNEISELHCFHDNLNPGVVGWCEGAG